MLVAVLLSLSATTPTTEAEQSKAKRQPVPILPTKKLPNGAGESNRSTLKASNLLKR